MTSRTQLENIITKNVTPVNNNKKPRENNETTLLRLW